MTHRGPFQPLPFCDSVIEGGDVLLVVGYRSHEIKVEVQAQTSKFS